MNQLDQLSAVLPGGPLALAVAGVVLLLAGKRLIWLLVAAAGFLAGVVLALHALDGQMGWPVLAVGLAAGLIGAGVAVLVQRLAVRVVGFLAGGLAALWLQDTFALLPDVHVGIVFLGGALVAGALSMAILDWSLIVLTAVAGAAVLVHVASPRPALAALGVLFLTVVGVAVQTRPSGRGQRRRKGGERLQSSP